MEDVMQHDQYADERHHRRGNPGEEAADLLVIERTDRPGAPADGIDIVKGRAVQCDVGTEQELRNGDQREDDEARAIADRRVTLHLPRREHQPPEEKTVSEHAPVHQDVASRVDHRGEVNRWCQPEEDYPDEEHGATSGCCTTRKRI